MGLFSSVKQMMVLSISFEAEGGVDNFLSFIELKEKLSRVY